MRLQKYTAEDNECDACGEPLGGEIAEVWDGVNHRAYMIVHVNCIPEGWEIA